MLKQIRLVNFQKHRSFSHTFSTGLTVCVGNNWAGKSTLLRAILYALFGTSAVPVKATNLATRGEKSFLVELEFEVAGVPYRVERGKTKAALYRSLDHLATGQTQVTQEIERLIGASARNFLTFNVAQQDEAGSLLSLGAQKLGQHLADITGVTVVDDVIERARERMIPLKDVPEKLLELTRQLERSDQKLAALNAELQRLGKELSSNESLSAAKFSYEEAGSRAQALSELRNRYVQWASDYAHLKESAEQWGQQRREAEETLAKLGEEPDVEALWGAYDSLAKQRHRFAEYESKLKELLAARANGAASLEQFEKQLRGAPDVSSSLQEHQLAYTQANEGLSALLAEISSVQSAVASAICHACNRPFDRESFEQAKARLESLEDSLPAQKTLVGDLAMAYTQAQAHHERRTRLEKAKAQWEEYAARTEAAIVSLPEVADAPAEAVSEARRAYEKAAEAKGAVDAAKHALRIAGASETSFRERLAALTPVQEVSEAAVTKARAEAEWLSEAYQQALSAHDRVQQAYNQTVFEQRAASEVRAFLLGSIKEESAREQRLQRLGQLIKYLRVNRDRFLQQTWQELLGYASEFVSEATDGDIKGIVRSEQGEFAYLEGDQEMPVELASGMQRSILGVAVKLAMSAALGSSFPVLLLDEVSAAASDENSLILTDLLAKTGQQVFLVTHREADSAVAESVLSL